MPRGKVLPAARGGKCRRQIDGSQVKVSLQGAVLVVKDYLGNDDGFCNNLSLRELRVSGNHNLMVFLAN